MAVIAANTSLMLHHRHGCRTEAFAPSSRRFSFPGRFPSHPKRHAKPVLVVAASIDSATAPTAAGASRRELFAAAVGASVALSGLTSLSAQAREKFVQAGGIEYYDAVIGKGETTFDGDTIRVTFTAHTYDPETGKKIKTFDPFITGGGGSSMAQGFKLTLGNVNGDIIPGLNLGIVGGDGVEPMRAGGKRVIRIPPELAFGSEGHSCYLGLKDQCTVPPNTPVEIELAFINFV